MNRKRFFGLLLAICAKVALAQHWVPAELPGLAANVQRVWSNSEKDTIYYAGSTRIDQTALLPPSNAVMRYANGAWDTLGYFNGILFAVAQYGDTLVVGGWFTEINGLPISTIAGHVNGEWIPYGQLNNGVRNLRKFGNDLYAVGSFDLVDGEPSAFVAKRSGGQWVGLGNFDPLDSPGFLDIAFYNNELVAAGRHTIDGLRDIFRYDGANWHPLGPGIVGGLSGIRCLEVFQGSLYVGGQIRTSEGNAGENIMRWDGTQFHSVRDGVRWALGSSSTASVFTMTVHDDLLYVGGGFNFADSLPANGLATWDGTNWCVVPGVPSPNGIMSMDFYRDTLFIGTTRDTLEGQFINNAAKANGVLIPDTCKMAVSIHENVDGQEIQLFPNPFSAHFQLVGIQVGDHMSITDLLGRTVHSTTVTSPFEVFQFPFPTGMYTVLITDRNGIVRAVRKVVKQE